MGMGVKGLLFVSVVFLILLTSFIIASHVVTTSTGTTSYSVNEDIDSIYNISISNTDLGQTANITQVNITIPSSFSFGVNSNGTNATNVLFTNTSTILSWTNSTNFVINGSEEKLFWFNVTASTPGSYNLTVTTVNSTGNSVSNISVTINDTTVPSSITFVDPTSNNNSNLSQSYLPVNNDRASNRLS